MQINWKVRVRNKNFWIALVAAMLLITQQILQAAGVDFNFTELGDKFLAIVNSAFAVLTILGVVNDPTTAGISDSDQAMTYEEPKDDDVEDVDEV